VTASWLDALPDDSEAVRLLRRTDWAATPLGPAEHWEPALRAAVGLVLRSRFPLLIAWGPDLVQIYNDAMFPLVGDKHPQFGARIRDTWAEIWDVVGPMLHGVLDTGEATWSEDQLLLINRVGFPEDIYITFSYSALADDSGRPAAVLATTIETTERVLEARRMQVLHVLSTVAAASADPESLALEFMARVSARAEDLRFLTLHLDTGDGLRLVASTHGAQQLQVPLDAGDREAGWSVDLPLPEDGLSVPLREPVLPDTPLPAELQVPVTDVVLLPVVGGDGLRGVLSVGRSPQRRYDERYRSFLVLLAQQLGTALASASARQTERQRLEELRVLDQAKRDFLGDVSHEFRTPLTLIGGPLRSVLEGGGLVAADHERLELALRATERLTRLVDSLLDYSRAESGVLTAEPVAVDLAAQVRLLAELFRSGAEAAGLELVVDLAELPHPVLVDPQQLETVVVNLLSNALKFTMVGEVRVVVRASDRAAVLEVLDTGMGIPEEDLPFVFDRFRRGRAPAARSVEGTGIGLSLVRKLVELQGGEIAVRSRPGAGTAFRVELPWAVGRQLPAAAGTCAVPSAQAASLATEVEGWASPTRSGGLVDALLPRVVLAEDNADVRAFVTDVLAGHVRLESVGDGSAALQALRAEPADLLLTDLRMPVMDGRQLLAAVRSDPVLAPLPVVLFSAHADRDAAVDALAAGADDYLVKPFTPAQLVARVRSSIELARTRRQAALLRAYATAAEGAVSPPGGSPPSGPPGR
jgi:signal transduction histidine kinase/FixJ family two-component response regulator